MYYAYQSPKNWGDKEKSFLHLFLYGIGGYMLIFNDLVTGNIPLCASVITTLEIFPFKLQ